MLTELRIANFAVIDRLTLQFSTGFHVFTGETGAGKSILVDAIALLVGGRATTDVIRAEAEEAEVEAAFTLPEHQALLARFRDSGVLEPQDTDLIIRRVIARTGRNRVYLNGRLTPLHVLEALAGTLLDLHGQHDQQSLLAASAQLNAVDEFGGLAARRAAYTHRYESLKAGQRRLEEVKRQQHERTQREDYLRYQFRELEAAALAPGEEESLLVERKRLAHVKRLRDLGEEAYDRLYGSDASVLKELSVAENRLAEVTSVDETASEWNTLCRDATVNLQEVTRQLRAYLQGLEQDPERLSAVEDRLHAIQQLKRKHGGSFESVLAKAAELREELTQFEGSEARIEELQGQVDRNAEEVRALARSLSEARVRAAGRLEARVKKELGSLRMGETQLQVVVTANPDLSACTATGWDRVDYLLSANPGEPPLPLAKVASGGELSRVMLALKTVLAERDAVPTLIFDEVDAGVGGAVAEVMGRRLKALGAHHQVFCITHLPQVASKADHHFVVEKVVQQKRTVARARRLEAKAREDEIARMLGGLTITQSVRQTAAEMVSDARGKR